MNSTASYAREITAFLDFCRDQLGQTLTSDRVTVKSGDAARACENWDQEGEVSLHIWGGNQVFMQSQAQAEAGGPLRMLITAQIEPQRFLLAYV